MTRARLHRIVDWVTLVVVLLVLASIAVGLVRSVLDRNVDTLLWQCVAALGHTVALLTLVRIRLRAIEEPTP